ncbi:MAG: hypothetical protein IJ196_04515 [Prevotella sp.]|nr:hypothetical protein [Prevotella sp.]
MLQYTIITIAITLAVAYAAWKIILTVRSSGTTDPHCAGCPLQEQCRNHQTKNKDKTDSCRKKEKKKFGNTEILS